MWVREFDVAIDVRWVSERVTRDNAAALIAGADLVLDGCDNFATRLAVSDACVAARVPLLSAAVGRFQGQVGAFAGHLPDSPCYRCYVGDAFDADDCDTCASRRHARRDGRLGGHLRRDAGDPRAARAAPAGWAIRSGASCTCSTGWRRGCGRCGSPRTPGAGGAGRAESASVGCRACALAARRDLAGNSPMAPTARPDEYMRRSDNASGGCMKLASSLASPAGVPRRLLRGLGIAAEEGKRSGPQQLECMLGAAGKNSASSRRRSSPGIDGMVAPAVRVGLPFPPLFVDKGEQKGRPTNTCGCSRSGSTRSGRRGRCGLRGAGAPLPRDMLSPRCATGPSTCGRAADDHARAAEAGRFQRADQGPYVNEVVVTGPGRTRAQLARRPGGQAGHGRRTSSYFASLEAAEQAAGGGGQGAGGDRCRARDARGRRPARDGQQRAVPIRWSTTSREFWKQVSPASSHPGGAADEAAWRSPRKNSPELVAALNVFIAENGLSG